MSKTRSYLIFFVVIAAFLLNSCEEQGTMEQFKEPIITGDVVSEINRACKYPNGDFCDEKCCVSNEICSDGKSAYQGCDLKTGVWFENYYSSAECSSNCDLFDPEKNVIVEEKPDLCTKGWRCVEDKYLGFQESDCELSDIELCDYGCANDKCNEKIICEAREIMCRPISF